MGDWAIVGTWDYPQSCERGYGSGAPMSSPKIEGLDLSHARRGSLYTSRRKTTYQENTPWKKIERHHPAAQIEES